MKGRKDISTLNMRVTIRQWRPSTDIGGGSSYNVANSWTVWANKRNKSGSQLNVEAQEQWNYQTTFTVRYNSAFKSNMTVDDNTGRWKIESIEIDNEAYKGMMLLRCSSTDEYVDVS